MFVDGTFRSSPSIFFQLFVIMGCVAQVLRRVPPHEVGTPFLYALLEKKHEVSFKKLLDILIKPARENNINVRLPHRLMTDFELAIINAAQDTFGVDKVSFCLFHLGQSVF